MGYEWFTVIGYRFYDGRVLSHNVWWVKAANAEHASTIASEEMSDNVVIAVTEGRMEPLQVVGDNDYRIPTDVTVLRF